ncbi:MAG: sulfatase-like hydrolase/transferase, partial [Thiohalomonadales bacterium]
VRRTNPQKLLPAISALLLWTLALASSYPMYSLISYQISLTAESSGPYPDSAKFPELIKKETMPDTARAETANEVPVIPKQTPTAPVKAAIEQKNRIKKNIVLIYAESLEQLYFDKEIFGDLLPNIRELSADAHRFTNLRQVRGTSWTTAGIVASQCGFPVKVSNHLASNSTIASVERPYPEEICLADILSDQGYETVYMGGAPLWFGGKGNFLKTHGYKRIFGDEELAPMLPNRQYRSGWGLYDDSLFKMVLKELKSLEKGGQPYFLTLLTLDTHHPKGISSKSCKKLLNNQDSMSNAIYCSDQLISYFIAETMSIVDMNETIIVLFSDHLALRNTLWNQLKANQQNRRLTFMIFDNAPGTESNLPGTHFDVAPTLLEAAGLTEQLRIGAGFSLLSQEASKSVSSQLSQEVKTTPTLLNQSFSAKKSGVDISRSDLSLSIGGLTLKANAFGQKFVSGMYLAVLNEEGNVRDAIYSGNYENLAKNLIGTFVVGISILPSQLDSVTYFYGRISLDSKGIIQRRLNRDTHLSADEILTSMQPGIP